MSDGRPRLGGPRLVSIFITTAALLISAAHLLWPAVQIDAITLGLLVLAVVPWLAPLFKSIELPGGWKVEFQELKREVARKGDQVAALASRVEQVEKIAFAGKTTPSFREGVTSRLGDLHDYFNRIGAHLDTTYPSVRVSEDAGAIGYYEPDKNEVVIGEEARENLDLVLRLYSLHVLGSLARKVNGEFNLYIQSGLATYFPCSFRNSPSLGLTPGEAEEHRRRTGQPYLHNLDHARRLTKRLFQRVSSGATEHVAGVWEMGAIWGGALWELRTAIGQDHADRAFLAAWMSKKWNPDDPVGSGWAEEVAAALDDSLRSTAAEIFQRRGLSDA